MMAAPGLVQAVFQQPGSIGMKFEEWSGEQDGQTHQWLKVTGITPGSQAAQNPELHVGMVVHSVGDQEVHTLSNHIVQELMRQRPVVFRFWSVPAPEQGTAAPAAAADAYAQQPGAQQHAYQPEPQLPATSSGAPVVQPPQPAAPPRTASDWLDWAKPAARTSSHMSSATGYGSVAPNLAQIDHAIGTMHRTQSGVPGGDFEATVRAARNASCSLPCLTRLCLRRRRSGVWSRSCAS